MKLVFFLQVLLCFPYHLFPEQINYATTVLLLMQISLKHQVMESILHSKYFLNSTLLPISLSVPQSRPPSISIQATPSPWTNLTSLTQLQPIFYFSAMIKESKRKVERERERRRRKRKRKWKERKRSKVLFKDFIAEIQLD